MTIATLILTWNGADVVLDCLRTIAYQQHQPDMNLVVDNASTDATVTRIRQHFPTVALIENPTNLGFARGMNIGITALNRMSDPPDIVVLLNQDTLLDPECLAAMVAPLREDPKIAAVGGKIRYPDGTIQHAGAYLEWPRAVTHHTGWHEPDTGQYDQPRSCDMVTAAAIALRMEALQTVGLFDPGYSPAYYEDADLCWRLRYHGYQIVYQPAAVLTHHESLSIKDGTLRSSYYNRGRLRLVLKTYPYQDIIAPFAESELAFIRTHGYAMEARALRWAYLATLGNLNDIAQARQGLQPALTSEQLDGLAHFLIQCKQELTRTLYHRAHTTLSAVRFHLS